MCRRSTAGSSSRCQPRRRPASLFRLRGRGVPAVRGGPTGDLLCRVVIETPVRLSDKQKDLLRQFSDSVQANGTRHSPKESSWFQSVKSFFEGLA